MQPVLNSTEVIVKRILILHRTMKILKVPILNVFWTLGHVVSVSGAGA